MCDIFSEIFEHAFVDKVGRKRRSFKNFGHDFGLLRSQLLVITKVSVVSKSFKYVTCFVAR